MKARFFAVLMAMSFVSCAKSDFAAGVDKKTREKWDVDNGSPSETAAQSAGEAGDPNRVPLQREGMMGLLRMCREHHKSDKLCEHEVLEKCQKNLSGVECRKMLKEAKFEEESLKGSDKSKQ